MTLRRGQKVKYHYHVNFKDFFYQTLCVFSRIKDRKHIEQNFHSVARVMPRDGTKLRWGVKNFSVGICDGAPSTACSSHTFVVVC